MLITEHVISEPPREAVMATPAVVIPQQPAPSQQRRQAGGSNRPQAAPSNRYRGRKCHLPEDFLRVRFEIHLLFIY